MDQLSCPHCSNAVLNDPALAGQVVACPNCQKQFRMPGSVNASPVSPPTSNSPAPSPTPLPTKPEKPKDKKETPKMGKILSSKPANASAPTNVPPSSPADEPVSEHFSLANLGKYLVLLGYVLAGLAILISIVGSIGLMISIEEPSLVLLALLLLLMLFGIGLSVFMGILVHFAVRWLLTTHEANRLGHENALVSRTHK